MTTSGTICTLKQVAKARAKVIHNSVISVIFRDFRDFVLLLISVIFRDFACHGRQGNPAHTAP